jgi:isoleucyl-tRNA synthetase
MPKMLLVISGDFVTIDDGTGIVHTSPTLVDDAKEVPKEARISAA